VWPLLLAGGVVAAGLARSASKADPLAKPDATQLEGSGAAGPSAPRTVVGLGGRLNTDVPVHAPTPRVKPKNTITRSHKGQPTKLGAPTTPGPHKVTVVSRAAKASKKAPTLGGVAKSAAKAGLSAAGVPPWGTDAAVGVGSAVVGGIKSWF
jgi:hypothetical protein